MALVLRVWPSPTAPQSVIETSAARASSTPASTRMAMPGKLMRLKENIQVLWEGLEFESPTQTGRNRSKAGLLLLARLKVIDNNTLLSAAWALAGVGPARAMS